MTESIDNKTSVETPSLTEGQPDSSREILLRAAAHQFAHRTYSQVSLDDILTDAQLTKGAMYRNFSSKRALALALIDRRVSSALSLLDEIQNRRMSGIEILVDTTYTLAAQDTTDDFARAGFSLLESVGRIDSLRSKLSAGYAEALADVVRRGVDEGDIDDRMPPDAIGRLLVALYTGLVSVNDLDRPQEFMRLVEETWMFTLHALVRPDRIAYLSSYVRRRTSVAVARLDRGFADGAPS